MFLATLASLLLNNYTELVCKTWWISLVYFTLIFLILNSVYNLKRNTEEFTQLLLSSIMVKLLLSLTVILVYKIINKATLFNFAMHFLIHYFLFTIFEMYDLVKSIKTKQS
jgi:hypothetical protein